MTPLNEKRYSGEHLFSSLLVISSYENNQDVECILKFHSIRDNQTSSQLWLACCSSACFGSQKLTSFQNSIVHR